MTCIKSILSIQGCGLKKREVGKGTPPQTKEIRDTKPFTSIKKENKDWLPFFEGKHIERNKLLWDQNNWILYGGWLAAPREKQNFEGEKILIRKIVSDRLIAHYIPKTSYCNTLLFILKIMDGGFTYPYVLSILNSKLIGWYYKHKFQISDEDTFPQIMIRDIMKFPIYANKNSVNLDRKILELIEKSKQLESIASRFHHRLHDNLDLEKLSKKLQRFWEHDFKTLLGELKKNKITLALKQQDEWEEYFDQNKADIQALQTEIDRIDVEIDRMVYALYGLTDEEIQIVEGA